MNGRKAKLRNKIAAQIAEIVPAWLATSKDNKTKKLSKLLAEKWIDDSPKTIRELRREFGR